MNLIGMMLFGAIFASVGTWFLFHFERTVAQVPRSLRGSKLQVRLLWLVRLVLWGVILAGCAPAIYWCIGRSL